MAGNPNEPSPLTFFGSNQPVARRVARPMARFLHVEAASGLLLVLATAAALIWANVPAIADSYNELWETRIVVEVGDYEFEGHDVHDEDEAHAEDGETASGDAASAGEGEEATTDEAHAEDGEGELHGISLRDIVNDGLMAIFFFVVGMEIKMELVNGQLRDPRAAALPGLAALGGMVVPALIFVALNWGGAGIDGWGIPMATDIAFALGVLSLLGSRVPVGLKVFLLTLAIVDDIGAILVIAIFYTEDLDFVWLSIAAGLVVVMTLMKRVRIWYVPLYVFVGAFIWYTIFESGIHATIAGVLMGLLTPARPLQRKPHEVGLVENVLADDGTEASDVRRAQFEIRETVSVAERLIELLHPWTSFIIIPLFALANAGIELSSDSLSAAASSRVTWGVVLGLLVGKLVGISAFSALAVRLGLSTWPQGVRFVHVMGLAVVAGIGFTVSIFIAGLAYDDLALQDEAKIGILFASVVAAVVGGLILRRTLEEPTEAPPPEVTADF